MTKLTEEMVIARSKQSDLASIKKLNCWGSDLSDVSIIRRMRGVEVLALSVNKISTLQHFQDCQNLQELYLRRNNVQDIHEIEYLQNLPNLKYLWLEENPCCDQAGDSYRPIVLRALPNLKKLDNVDVTPEEVDEAMSAAPLPQQQQEIEEDDYEDSYQDEQYQQPPPQSQYSSPPPQSQPQPQQQQQRVAYSPPAQRSPPNQDQHNNTPPEVPHPPSPKYNNHSNSNNRDNRLSYHQYDRSPASEEVPEREYRQPTRGPIPPSMSTHSMKEYYQSDRPAYPAHYRHSQSDLTEWEEHNQYNGGGNHPPQYRRSAGNEREPPERYPYRNGNARDSQSAGDWEEDRASRRRSEGRFIDSPSVPPSVMNHYAGYHRRPVNRSSNLLSATLCLVKELDYSSLEVVEHAVRCRIDELSAE
ncbi:C21orf2 family protein [Megaselia abdita]